MGNEIPTWGIDVQRTSYYRYASLLKDNLDTEYDDPMSGRRTTIRNEYLRDERFNERRPPVFLTSFGVGLTVYLQRDKRLVFTKRGRTELEPGTFGNAVNESLHSKDIDENDPSGTAVRCAIRGAWEELGIQNATSDMLNFLSVGFTVKELWYALRGILCVDLSFEELKRVAARAPDRRFEIENIYSIPAQPVEVALQELFCITQRYNHRWNAGYLANLLLAIRFFNQDTYDKYTELICHNPQRAGVSIPYSLLFPPLP